MPQDDLLARIHACQVCSKALPEPPRPILQHAPHARLCIIGQAPGRIAHETATPWNDQSGERLRMWLGMTKEEFYDANKVAIVPMGFCFPGHGASGDLPPRKECAPLWHARLFAEMPHLEVRLLIGQYAQAYYLNERRKKNLTLTVKAWREYAPNFIPLPHPSPRNNIWLRKNPWFEEEVLPPLRHHLKTLA